MAQQTLETPSDLLQYQLRTALTMEADALSSGWRGCRRCADIDEREVIASRRGRAIERDRLVNGSACSCYDSSGRVNRTVSEPHSEGRCGDRARLARSESARHFCATPSRTFAVIERCCRSCPGASVRLALHVGRREGDAVWHRRSDCRIAQPEFVVNSVSADCERVRA